MTLLDDVLTPEPPPFALLHRPGALGADRIQILTGDVTHCSELADLPVPDAGGTGPELLTLLPYRQIRERGFAAIDDGTPITALAVRDHAVAPLEDVVGRLPDEPVDLADEGWDIGDAEYAQLVRDVIGSEIGRGEGANFVIHRSYRATLGPDPVRAALSIFRRLLGRESGAYWTFVVHTGDRLLVGASPELHVRLEDGVVGMNPISGTYRYPASGARLDGVLSFLDDGKETNELYMVLDEELKMMARLCPEGGRVVGPFLKEMARLAHTEYLLEGRSDRDVRDILRETMFAPTVTGSPLKNACQVIARHETGGRGYYSGCAALIGSDATGRRTLDSTILIRTADIDRAGGLRIGVGATLVRDSDPDSEVQETAAKAAGLLAAVRAGSDRIADDPRVVSALAERNENIADFWLADVPEEPAPPGAGAKVLVVDAEDTFTAMLRHQLTAIGHDVVVHRHDEPFHPGDHDLVVMGPGPGDPRRWDDERIGRLHDGLRTLLEERRPFLAICLSHQVLCTALGLDVVRRPVPQQGVQREIDLFGRTEKVGFYNTFSATSERAVLTGTGVGPVEVARDPRTGEVHALRGEFFASLQFHPESVLTPGGVGILARVTQRLLCFDWQPVVTNV